jgi:OCT family organic cation transporter-like MFS transporter 4/5
VGEFALVIIGVALPSWRGQFAAGAVLCAASLLLWFVVPESGRWLQAQGRTEEAQQSLAALARLNGTRPPPVPLAAHAPEAPAQPAASAAAAYAVGIESGSTEEGQALPTAPAGRSKQGLGAALRDVHIARRFVILAYAWLVMCMVRLRCRCFRPQDCVAGCSLLGPAPL